MSDVFEYYRRRQGSTRRSMTGKMTIVKNYVSTNDLVEIFSSHVERFKGNNVFLGRCFWYVDYEL